MEVPEASRWRGYLAPHILITKNGVCILKNKKEDGSYYSVPQGLIGVPCGLTSAPLLQPTGRGIPRWLARAEELLLLYPVAWTYLVQTDIGT
jgi:hypothetical protein